MTLSLCLITWGRLRDSLRVTSLFTYHNLIMARQTIASLTAELEELRPLANGKTEADLREQQQALFILLAAVATIGFIF